VNLLLLMLTFLTQNEFRHATFNSLMAAAIKLFRQVIKTRAGLAGQGLSLALAGLHSLTVVYKPLPDKVRLG
jgi:hypothetical protein